MFDLYLFFPLTGEEFSIVCNSESEANAVYDAYEKLAWIVIDRNDYPQS